MLHTGQVTRLPCDFVWWTYLFDELYTGSQVHPKVNELPLNTFLLVFFLLQHKHVMVEKLLQFLICEVDTQLLQAVELQHKPFWARTVSGACMFENLSLANLHQRFQILQCPGLQWRTAGAAWCPTSDLCGAPSTETSSHRLIWPKHQWNCRPAQFQGPVTV